MKDAFATLAYDNSFVRELPADPIVGGRRRQVEGACYSRTQPTPVSAPLLAAHAHEVATLVGFQPGAARLPSFVDVLGGNRVTTEMDPYAACYGGHQFGNWAGQLGDGRAISLCEVLNAAGERWELQLKGAGPTPYSRMGDGRAVLRSSIREFICSEAMHHLGVPTTRALSLVVTGDQIVRDMFYDGRPEYEPGAVVCRVAPSFIRFGNFEILAAQGNTEVLRQLADYTIGHHFPDLGEPGTATYLAFFETVCQRTALMLAHWMRVGFVHGVMNTDNMSVLGLTIDYGPYGWLDDYDPDWTPNTTDTQRRRYRYGHQPKIGLWNLIRFANSLYPLVEDAKPFEAVLDLYVETYESAQREMMAAKLGLPKDVESELVSDLSEMLQIVETDMTLFYRCLAALEVRDGAELSDAALVAHFQEAHYLPEQTTTEDTAGIARWLRRYQGCVAAAGISNQERRTRMNAVNPKFVPRNYQAQVAIDQAEAGDYTGVETLLEVLRRPYDEQPDYSDFAAKRPEWARSRPGCSTLSCSS